MRDLLARLRAAMPTQAMLALLCALLLFVYSACSRDGATTIERRAERVLSSVSGAGRVCVVVHMRTVGNAGGASASRQAISVPAGAIAVAQGADDPVVHYQLQQALCALLSLPASAVSIVTGGN